LAAAQAVLAAAPAKSAEDGSKKATKKAKAS
jgi:hypothetical protein